MKRLLFWNTALSIIFFILIIENLSFLITILWFIEIVISLIICKYILTFREICKYSMYNYFYKLLWMKKKIAQDV